jgi:hypothetical protein
MINYKYKIKMINYNYKINKYKIIIKYHNKVIK